MTFKINFTFNESLSISNLILGQNILNLINHDLINYYNTPGEIISLFNDINDNNIDVIIIH